MKRPFNLLVSNKLYKIFYLLIFIELFLWIPFSSINSDDSKIKNIRGFPDVNYTENYVSETFRTNDVKNDFYDKSPNVNSQLEKGGNNSNQIKDSIPDLKIVLDKKEIYHYEIQSVYIYDYGNLNADNFNMRVYHNGDLAPSLGMIESIPFIKVKDIKTKNKKVLKAVYLPNWNAADGIYRVKIFYKDKELKTAEPLKFIIKRRKLREIKDGLSIVDLEMNKNLNDRIIKGISGNITGPEGILEWASFLNADALWILSGETTSFPERIPLRGKEYWDAGPISNLRILEKYSKKYNVKIGAYIMSFFVPGKKGVPERYQSGIGYNSEKDSLYKSRHISLSSENRINDIINLVKEFQRDSNISYIGFDFIRTGRADGYELVDEFIDEMNIKINENLYSQSWKNKTKRIKWLARKIEVERDPIIIEKWRWWRAHKVALIVKRIMKEAKVTKPVWVYTLGWEHGKEHGQDPVMFFDAGVDIDAVMLYEANHNQYEKMMAQWQEYISAKQGNIIIGNCVDYKLLDSDTLSPPQELYRRNVVGSTELFKDGPARGIFLHDMYRLLWGRRGNYKGWQYALSFSSSVFNMRQSLGITDILTDIMINDSGKSGLISGDLYLKNLGDHSLELYISSFPFGEVDFYSTSKRYDNSKHISLDLFGTKKVSFETGKRDVFFHVQVGKRSSYYFPIME